MKIFILFFYCLFIFLTVKAQQKDIFFYQGVAFYEEQEYEKAIAQFDLSINKKPDNHKSYFYRALCKIKIALFEEAFQDISKSIRLNKKDFKAFTIQAFIKQKLGLYHSAKRDLDSILKIDVYNLEGFFQRGFLFTYFNQYDSACLDFSRSKYAIELAMKAYEEFCKKDKSLFEQQTTMFYLQERTNNHQYGFSPKFPIKVGRGIFGGVENEIAYIELLRDAQKKPVIAIERVGKCCPTNKENGDLYHLDKFNITYYDDKNKQQNKTIYITYEDYEKPLLPVGFHPITIRDSTIF